MDVAGAIGAAAGRFGGMLGVKPCTLIKVTPGTPTPGSLIDGTNPVETSYPCMGKVDAYDPSDIDGTLIVKTDRRITLVGSSLPVEITPVPGDKVTIAGPDGTATTYRIKAPIGGDGTGGLYSFPGEA